MAVQADDLPIKIFMSYRNSPLSSDWVRLAAQRLRRRFELHNYVEHPEQDPDLPAALTNRIKASDVFVAFLTRDYLESDTTRAELEAAIEIATGVPGGSLRSSHGRLIVYLIVADSHARRWCDNYQSSFTYFALADYDFNYDAVVAKSPGIWDQWVENIETRVGEARQQVPPLIVPIAGLTKLVILGRPEVTANSSAQADVDTVVTALGNQIPVKTVAEGWYSRRDASGASAARAVLEAGPRSLLLQVCDEVTWVDNQFNPAMPGEDLLRKLQRTGLTEAEAQKVLGRTWFWLPRSCDSLTTPTADGTAVSELLAENIGLERAMFGSATPAHLADLLRMRFTMNAVRLEAEDGIRDIGPRLNIRLQPYFDPLVFEVVSPARLPMAIRYAAQIGAPVLVVIHDRPVAQTTPDKVGAIRNRVQQFDEFIRKAMSDAIGGVPRIARAVLVINNPNELPPDAVITDDTWEFVPVDVARDCEIPEAPLRRLQEKLGLQARH
jgi:hypothetical protein